MMKKNNSKVKDSYLKKIETFNPGEELLKLNN